MVKEITNDELAKLLNKGFENQQQFIEKEIRTINRKVDENAGEIKRIQRYTLDDGELIRRIDTKVDKLHDSENN